MIVYKYRPDLVYEGPVELPDAPFVPRYHTFQPPPEIPDGHYAMMRGGWVIIKGTPPNWPPIPSPEEIANQIKAEVVEKTQERLDNFAKTREYDGILSACTYVNSLVTKFQTEGAYCVQKRDETWAKLYQILAEVETGVRPMPASFEDIESELPQLQWPTV